jgi:NAD(P)-dependent dehydrogenase (short-subunit alcohol dehydrogenase family)
MEKTILITGGLGGIGQSLAKLLHQQDWRVAVTTRKEDAVHSDFPLIISDVSTPEGAEQAIAAAEKIFAAPPAALAHCAGQSLLMPLHRTSESQYRQCLAANLDSAFFTLQAFIKAGLADKAPSAAVLVASVVGAIGVSNHEAIAAAKAGIIGLTQAAAATYAPWCRVNAVSPGLTATPAAAKMLASEPSRLLAAAQYPLGRYGEARDIAEAMAFLLQAPWITGQILSVDGGFTAVRPVVKP